MYDAAKSLGWKPSAKTSNLFLDLLDKLLETYPRAKVIHVVLDNYRIHKSTSLRPALAGYLHGRIELHFLPPTVRTITASNACGRTSMRM